MRLPDAVIAGFEKNGLGVARALARERIPSIAVSTPTWNPAWHSRTVRKVIACREWSSDCFVETLITIGKALPSVSPLLITKDEPVLWISKYRDDLSPYYSFALPPHDIVELLMSKVRFEAYAREQKWPVPASWLVNSRAQLNDCIEAIHFPCILKVAVKNTAFRHNSGAKAFKLHDADSLRQTYNTVQEWERDVIIQEFITGGDDRVVYGLGCWSKASETLALFAGRKLRQWPPECGGTAIAVAAPEEWVDPILSLTCQIMDNVRYVGLGSVEFKMRPNGTPVIIEPTVGRTNYQNEIAVINGVNIPAAAYFDLIGRREASRRWFDIPRPVKPIKLIDEEGDKLAAAVLIEAGTLTHDEWTRSRAKPRKFMLYRPEDPLPFAAATIRRVSGAVQRRITRLLGQSSADVADKPEALA